MRKIYLFILVSILSLGSIFNAYSQTVVTIGTGALTSYLYGPIYRSSATSNFIYSRYAYLYTETELGIPCNSTITKVEWYLTSGTINANNTFNVLMFNSSSQTLTSGSTWGTLTSGATSVYSSTTQAFTPAASWLSFTLSTPFTYTGGSLQIFTDHVKSGTASAACLFPYTASTGKAIGVASNTALTNSSTLTTTYGGNRPNIRITYTTSACAGTPSPGNTQASSTSVCYGGGTTNLSLQNCTSGSGVTYQWQSSSNGGTWANISGATNSTYSATVTSSTYYRCAVTCSGNTGFSNSQLITVSSPPSFPYSE
jgi:hypothetical protein